MKKDLLNNLLSVALPTLVLQIIVLPFINSIVGVNQYGLAISSLAVLNSVSAVVGNSLCNVRQLMEGEYRSQQLRGDFSALNIIFGAGTTAIAVIFCASIGLTAIECALIAVLSLFMQLYNYALVFFRIDLDFHRALIASAIQSIGLLLGTVGVYFSGLWMLALLLGYGASLIYIGLSTPLLKEPIRFTPLSRKTIRVEMALLGALLLSALVTYGDRLILLPLLGAATVSVFYISSLVGKMLVMVISPMSTVLLSYLARQDSYERSEIKARIALSGLLGILFWIATIIVAPPVLGVLYPNEYVEALRYVPLITLSSIAQAICSVMNPLIMRFFSSKWQLITNAISFLVLLVTCFPLVSYWGLFGFCIACVASSCLRLFMILALLLKGDGDGEFRTL